MGLDNIKLALRQLSYTDMQTLARELGAALQMTPVDAETGATVAKALLALPTTIEGPPSMEEKYFAAAFRRKRTISVRRQGKGYIIDCSTIPGAHVMHASAREGVSQLLDLIVGLKALE